RALGARLRELRLAAGLSQSALARGRFSKEYVSQIERGKTRPTPDTIEWLAGLLTSGLSTTDRGRLETAVARAEALVQAHRDDEAVDAFRELRPRVSSVAPDLDLRTLTGQAWSHLTLGQIDEAVALLNEARSIAEGEAFT